ncbi:hypothetical protein BB559_003239 [Furculomyces boomerangus]|uniref:CCHC-type domain-containing protein n=1 Tax=Furculomyces boomerangus TaxID=61424 RepID=A0A2T9YMI8_9FUNG|nr:hypothetical protein BB559_003239 [Furculomyces boomerangus]
MNPQNPQQVGAQRGGSLHEDFSKIPLKSKPDDLTELKSPESGESLKYIPFNQKEFFDTPDENPQEGEEFSESEEFKAVYKMPKPSNPDAPRFEEYCKKGIEERLIRSPVYRLGIWSNFKQFMIAAFKNDDPMQIDERDLDIYQSGLIESGQKRQDNVFISLSKAANYIKRILISKHDISFRRHTPSQVQSHPQETKGAEIKSNWYPVKDSGVEQRKFFVCIHCNKAGHGKRECPDLSKNYSKGLIKFDILRKILDKNGVPLLPSFGRGGIKSSVLAKENISKLGLCMISQNVIGKNALDKQEKPYFQMKRLMKVMMKIPLKIWFAMDLIGGSSSKKKKKKVKNLESNPGPLRQS